MRCMAMLLLTVVVAAVTECIAPNGAATPASLQKLVDVKCTVLIGDLHLGSCTSWFCTDVGSYSSSNAFAGPVDLGAVTPIRGRLTIWGDSGITKVVANMLTRVAGIEIAQLQELNTNLVKLEMPSLVNVTGKLAITDTNLRKVFFPSLLNVNGRLLIKENNALSTVGLDALQTVGVDFNIQDNTILSFVGLSSLLKVEGSFRIMDNTILSSEGLNSLLKVGGDFRIVNNPMLTTVGLDALQTVGAGLNILNNDALSSVGLDALKTVGDRFRIQDNDILSSVSLNDLLKVEGGRSSPIIQELFVAGSTTSDPVVAPPISKISAPTAAASSIGSSPTSSPTASSAPPGTLPMELITIGVVLLLLLPILLLCYYRGYCCGCVPDKVKRARLRKRIGSMGNIGAAIEI